MPTTRHAIDRKDLIEGLGKGLRVIECFDDDHVRITPAETAARANVSRTAARRYLLSLVHFGYAASDGKRFWLLPRVLRLGQGFLDSARLPRLVQPFIQRVSMQSGETVNVSVLDGHEVVYIARSNSPRVVSDRLPPRRADAGACGDAGHRDAVDLERRARSTAGSPSTSSARSRRRR